MNWYYVDAGQQVGPVAEADFQSLASTGKIQGDTLVWREGMADWLPYSQAGGAATQPPVVGGIACSQCGNTFSPDNVARFGEQWVCANCKPIYLQKMREGVGSGGTQASQVTIEEAQARDYDVDIGQCYRESTTLYKANFGNILGATVAVMGILIVIGFIPFMIGALIKMVLGGPMMGGLYLFYVRRIRGEEVTTGDAFAGFKSNFVNLMLTNVVTTILAGLCFVPGAFMVGVSVVFGFMGHTNGQLPHIEMTGMVIAGFVALALGACGATYLMTSWCLALPLVADKKLGFWQAMDLSRKIISKHWWAMLGLLIVSSLVTGLGVLACGIGVIFTLPLGHLMVMHQYQRLLGDLEPAGL